MLVGACGMIDLLARRGTSVASTGRTVRIGRTANTMYPAERKLDARRWGSFGTSAAEVGVRNRAVPHKVPREVRSLCISCCPLSTCVSVFRTIRRIRPSRPAAQGHDWP
jgi:hypothetical protein